jgi:sugar phosphate isomerase/epimerase
MHDRFSVSPLSRRSFLAATAAAAGAFAVPHVVQRALAAEAAKAPPIKIPDDHKINGFAIGCQAWTFNRFTVLEAIEKTAKAGGRVIEFYPNQTFRKDQPAVRWGHGAPQAVIEQVQAKLKEHDIIPVNYGVVGLGSAAEIKQVFEFAKKLGIPAVTSEPQPKMMADIEKAIQEFDIRLCIHDHPKRDNDPSYKFWDPRWVLDQVKDRDPRMGACADTGHWVRSGVKPVEALKILQGRVFSSHLKDLNEFGKTNAHDVPYGTGVSGVKDVLDELRRQKFDGNISIEYEYKQEDNLAEVTKCIEFVKAYK